MSYYVVIYATSIVLSLICGIWVFQRYRNLSGMFFLLFTIFGSAWFLFYFLFFSGINSTSLLLLFSRIDFGLSLWATFSLALFVRFFNAKKERLYYRNIVPMAMAYCVLLGIHIFTPFIIEWLRFSVDESVYREIPGPLYLLNPFLHFIGICGLIFYAAIQLRQQTYLNRIRLSRILLGSFVPLWATVILQLLLPVFNIWILERELIVFYTFFTVYVFHVLRRYYFSDVRYGIERWMVTITSIILTIIFLNLAKFVYVHFRADINGDGYWAFQEGYSIVDTFLSILIFGVIHQWMGKFFHTYLKEGDLKKELVNLRFAVSRATSLWELNLYLDSEMRNIFRASFTSVRLFSDKDVVSSELKKYFERALWDRIFINDLVFIEEKKLRFYKEELLKEIPNGTFIILPLFNRAHSTSEWVVFIGGKSLWTYYTTEEIDIFREISVFLELHVKYIETYERLHDLSVNLDKKVDEKTLEYNDLLNRQKEFISIISHEIKSPIANAVFQADSIIDDLNGNTPSIERARADLVLLNKQLQDTGELLSKLFSVQYYDTHDVALFRELVRISYLLETEYEVYSRMHETIHFIAEIDPDMGFVEIDRIQFQQVISNILGNAIKFADPSDPTIRFVAKKENKVLHIIVEDNGPGFQDIDLSRLFTRYSRGGGGSIGLGMGLYLCKRIVEMHDGAIEASHSETFGGARFDIRIPVD